MFTVDGFREILGTGFWKFTFFVQQIEQSWAFQLDEICEKRILQDKSSYSTNWTAPWRKPSRANLPWPNR